MQSLANRLAIQHFVNAYTQETGKGYLLHKNQQTSTQQAFSQGLTLLSLPIHSIQAQCYFPLSYVSRVGRHRLANLPQIIMQGQRKTFSPVAIVGLLLEELVSASSIPLDAASLVEKWIQSRDALQQFLVQREHEFDDLIKAGQSFIETEQALILGHSMHPAPKSRTGFVHEDWLKFSPEHKGKTQLHYWLVHQDYIAEGCATDESISSQLKNALQWYLSENDLNLLKTHTEYKLLPVAIVTLNMTAGFYIQDKFGLNSQQSAMYFTQCMLVVGVSLVLTQLLIVKFFKFKIQSLVLIGISTMILGLLISLYAPTIIIFQTSYIVYGISVACLLPAFTTGAAQAVSAHAQVKMASYCTTTQAIGLIVGPLLSTALYQSANYLPFIFLLIANILLASYFLWKFMFSTKVISTHIIAE